MIFSESVGISSCRVFSSVSVCMWCVTLHMVRCKYCLSVAVEPPMKITMKSESFRSQINNDAALNKNKMTIGLYFHSVLLNLIMVLYKMISYHVLQTPLFLVLLTNTIKFKWRMSRKTIITFVKRFKKYFSFLFDEWR